MSLGFQNAGCQIIGGIDCEDWPVRTHHRNFTESKIKTDPIDIRELPPQSLGLKPGDIDILIGGPPCQGFSNAGMAKIRSLGVERERDRKNRLYKEFIKYVDYFKPAFFVIENVPGMKSYKQRRFLDNVIEELTNSGYDVIRDVLCASDFGVPQTRSRLFIIGRRRDLPHLELRFPQKRNTKPITVEEAISDLPVIYAKRLKTRKGTLVNPGARHEDKPVAYRTEAKSAYQRLMRKGNRQYVHNHVCRGHNEVDLKIFKKLKQGGKYIDLPARDRRYRDDIFKDKYRRLDRSKPSWTLTAHMQRDCLAYIHPTQTRSISAREAARLQSFPDNFIFEGPLTKVFRQIGNAVPPLLAQHVAAEIVDELRRVIIDQEESTA